MANKQRLSKPILSHTYAGRPLSANHLLPLYLAANAAPRPALTYLPNTATLIFKVEHANLLFLLTTSSEIEPLLALEFLHRIIDIFEDFLGAPLLSSKIEGNYDIVAQLLNETCDAGAVSTTEGNALRDLVEVEGWMGKLTGMLNLPPYVQICLVVNYTDTKKQAGIHGRLKYAIGNARHLIVGTFTKHACTSLATRQCSSHIQRALRGYNRDFISNNSTIWSATYSHSPWDDSIHIED